jgi:hypothetical protein
MAGAIAVALSGASARVAPPARAQANEAPADTTYTPRYLYSPVYNNNVDADVNWVGMANKFQSSLVTPRGLILNFFLSGDEKNYRLQDRFEETKILTGSALHTFRPGMNGSVTYTDSRIFNRTIAVGGGVQDFVINDRMAAAGANYVKQYDNLRMDWVGSGNLMNGERTFKTDRTLAGGISGGMGYNLFGDRVAVQGRAALRGSDDQSRTTEGREFTGLGSTEDSLAAVVRVEFADSIRFDASHRVYNGDRTFADQGRGSLGGQTGGAENVFEETEERDTRNTTIALSSYVFDRFGLKLAATRDEQIFDYAIQTTRFSRTVVDGVTGTISYMLPWQTSSTVTFENSTSLRDLGPQSISSLTDKRKKVALVLSRRFTKTLSMDFNGSSGIQQSFYASYAENPRDRDQLDSNLNLRISSQPFKKVSATVTLGYLNSSFINIDSTQSENNRTRELWELRPAFTYVVTDKFTIVQNYGLAIEYTDYDFKPNDNFLDRNITFSNEFQFRPTRAIDFRFEYALHLHDSGSYLPDPVTGERLLEVDTEDRRDRTNIRVDYRVTEHVRFFAENRYSRREDRTPGTDEVDLNTDGSLHVGTSADYDWGAGRKLKFSVIRVKRFSEFGAEAEKNYWDAHSEFAYPF